MIATYLKGAARAVVLAAVLAGPAAGAATAGDLVIEAPWARATVGTARPGVAYLTIRNPGGAADTLTGADTPVAGMVMIHRTEVKDGVSTMAPAGPVEIPAGGEVRLEPGGLHAMLMNLKQPLAEGETIPLILTFETAGRVEVEVPVLGIAATGPAE